MPENWQRAGFGLYLHWPFCEAKCPYCDFNSYVSSAINQSDWLRAYLSEIDRAHTQTADRVLSSVFFGGGTPSLMDEAVVGAILERVRSLWVCSNDMEVTLEANPGSVEVARFEGYHAAGVNRVSIGAQALNDPDLKRLGRLHSAEEALRAIEIAASTFDRYSFDLIYARQDQTRDAWQSELRQALTLGPSHLSAYQLTIEPQTAFGDRFEIGKLPGLPDDDLAADMYLDTQEICETHGLPAYEISNHARPGHASRHNLIYWRGGDYIGIGPGAHGRLTFAEFRFATETVLSPNAWLKKVKTDGTGEAQSVRLSEEEWKQERLMMSLRLAEGLDIAEFSGFDKYLCNKINGLEETGHLLRDGNTVKVAPAHRAILNAILREILA